MSSLQPRHRAHASCSQNAESDQCPSFPSKTVFNLFSLPPSEVTGLSKRETEAHAEIMPSLMFALCLFSRSSHHVYNSQSTVGAEPRVWPVSAVWLSQPGSEVAAREPRPGRSLCPGVFWGLLFPPQSGRPQGEDGKEKTWVDEIKQQHL